MLGTYVWREGVRRRILDGSSGIINLSQGRIRLEARQRNWTEESSCAIQAPRVRDRAKEIKFSSAILPPYLRRTKTIEELLPWLYLKGVSTGDFSEALTALLGRDAPGLSASTISRLKDSWTDEHGRWSRRSLVNKHYVYLWVDGVHFGVRLEDASRCMLLVIGATADGKKELVAFGDGYLESEASWKEVLLELKARGLQIDPKLAIDDGALGFWKALPQVFGHIQGSAAGCTRRPMC
jgi:transposase-like protein